MKRKIRCTLTVPGLIIIAGLGSLGLGWAGLLIFDIFDLFGMGTAWYETTQHTSLYNWFWVAVFSEGGGVEIMQWLLLGAASGFAFHINGRFAAQSLAEKQSSLASYFWLLMGIAFLLMLVEDAGNPRHWLNNFAYEITGGKSGQLVELLYFMILASIPMTALVFFSRPILRIRQTRNYLLLGFVFYAVASISSFTRYRWYDSAGQWLHENIFRGALDIVEVGTRDHGFWIMDFLIEESIELAAATMMAAAAASYLYHMRLQKI